MDKTIGHWIHLIDLKLKQDLNNRIACYQVTCDQWGLLNSIYLDEGLSQKRLAYHTMKDQASITRILDKLMAKGLVYKKFNSEDKRSFSLHLTEQGKELRNTLLPYTLQTRDKALQGLSDQQISQFKEMLQVIYQNMNGDQEV